MLIAVAKHTLYSNRHNKNSEQYMGKTRIEELTIKIALYCKRKSKRKVNTRPHEEKSGNLFFRLAYKTTEHSEQNSV